MISLITGLQLSGPGMAAINDSAAAVQWVIPNANNPLNQCTVVVAFGNIAQKQFQADPNTPLLYVDVNCNAGTFTPRPMANE
jgi:hypothetical protein